MSHIYSNRFATSIAFFYELLIVTYEIRLYLVPITRNPPISDTNRLYPTPVTGIVVERLIKVNNQLILLKLKTINYFAADCLNIGYPKILRGSST